MTMSDDGTEGRVAQRAAELLPEEIAAGSDDPYAQAEAILRDSDAREAGAAGSPQGEADHPLPASFGDLPAGLDPARNTPA